MAEEDLRASIDAERDLDDAAQADIDKALKEGGRHNIAVVVLDAVG